jgi:dihydrofolate synthase/folylpolyglutamate synthase
MIARQMLADLVGCLKPQIARFNRVSRYGSLTFFEACTALAFLYFREEKVDFAVLETGLGGRLDATNAVDALVSVITPISYEHTDKLGKTLAKIAAEKSGIIKFPSPISHIPYPLTVISAPQTKEALAVIRQRCRETGARLFVSGAKPGKLKTRLLGRHQLINAAVAVAAVRALRRHNIKVSASAIRRGLLHSKWPGRCEVVARRPLVILDGAQNAASAQALARAIKENFHYQRLILVLGISSDKDIAGICRQLCPLADLIVLTRANHPRAANIAVIEKAIRYTLYAIRYKIIKSGSVREARQKAKQVAGPQDLILVTGSLFLCGEYRRLQKNE